MYILRNYIKILKALVEMTVCCVDFRQFVVLISAFSGFVNPPNWNDKNVTDLDPNNSDNNGYKNEDLIVWMRTAALPSFRKLYRRIDHGSTATFNDGLPKGTYTIAIKYCKC